MTTPTIEATRRKMASGSVSAREVVDASIQAIEAGNSRINSFVFVDAERARARAALLDESFAGGDEVGPLHGVTMGVKDCIAVEGFPVSCGVSAWTQRFATRSASVMTRLHAAGAILIGMTNLHECALGVATCNPAFGSSRNPWDTTRVPGGSSGGSASAVAAGMVAFALGTDTGGSIRIPAGLCGISGLRPTTGLVSTDGVWPVAPSYDAVGPLAASIADLEIVLPVLAGDLSHASEERYTPRELAYISTDSLGWMTRGVQDAYMRALVRLEECGFRVVEIGMPYWPAIERVFSTLSLFEASRLHSERSIFSEDVSEVLRIGDAISEAEYARGLEERRELRRRVENEFIGRDALILPSTSHEAVRLGTTSIVWPDGEDEPLLSTLSRFSYMASLFGLPSVSLPMGLAGALPVGMQVVGGRHQDMSLLKTASRVEGALIPGLPSLNSVQGWDR